MKRGLLLLAAVIVAGLGLRLYSRLPEPRPVRLALPEPVATDRAARGRIVYQAYGCAMCHRADGTGGVANPNAETEGKVPAVIYVQEGYTETELARLIRHGTATIGREDGEGPAPPYRMPGWDRMTDEEVGDLVAFLFSLYPESAEDSWR